jgi:hypothetical protein
MCLKWDKMVPSIPAPDDTSSGVEGAEEGEEKEDQGLTKQERLSESVRVPDEIRFAAKGEEGAEAEGQAEHLPASDQQRRQRKSTAAFPQSRASNRER